jgi:peptide/nickel transport system substrate-binding protein
MEEDLRGNFVASPLLTQTPTTANGGVRLHPFTITFHIDPRAAWTDRTPITAVDFAFTWRAILHTKGARSTAGYDQIRSIDASDPAIVVIHFKAPYGDWPELFGGSRGFVLKRTAFRPAQRRSGDLSNAMHDLIGFSGGPWKMTQWTQRQEILVRNDRYWSNQSLLDQVTLIPIATQSLGVESLLRGQLDVIALTRPSQGLVDRMRSDPNVRLAIGRRTVTAWRADKVAGPIGKDSSSVYGPFFNMDLWHERSS